MEFDVYPATQTNPLSLLSGATSTADPITERIGVGIGPTGNDAMLMRLVMINPASPCAPAPAGPDHPDIILIADGGTPVTLHEYPNLSATIFNSSAQYVGVGFYEVEANGVYLITVDFTSSQTGTGNNWEFQLTNNAVATREFVWVVADNLAQTAQPWMELPQDLDVDTVLGGDTLLTGQAAQIALTVTNKGTGPLNVLDVPGVIGGSEFEIISVPSNAIDPNHCDDILLQFNAPASSGTSSRDYDVSSDDTTAQTGVPGATHNQRVALSGTAGKLEVMLVLDTSGSMAYTPDGSAPGVSVSDMRWGHLKLAAKQFLDLLSAFAGDLGRVGIVLFPDIVSGVPDPHVADSYVLQNATDIPEDVTPLQDMLDDHTPTAHQGNTPLGFGIGTTMGTTGGSFGEYLGSGDDVMNNPRWMVVMSDGFHNLGPPDPDFFYGTEAVSTSFLAKNVKVTAVSYGDPGAVNWPPDPAQMQDLATESEGIYLDAGLDDIGSGLAKSFRSAIIAGLYLDPTVDPTVILTHRQPEVRRDISVLPYDNKVCFAINWVTEDSQRVNVQILTPDCQLITAAVAEADPNIKYVSSDRYQLFTFNRDFLTNSGDDYGHASYDYQRGGEPRYGTWKLIISVDDLGESGSEQVEYDVITQSRLRMRLTAGKNIYYAGDEVKIDAALTLDGKPIRNASVTLHVTTPGNAFNNWVSQIPITSQEFKQARDALGPVETTGIAVKSHAIHTKGLTYRSIRNTNTQTMTDPDDTGIYSATIPGSSVPGTYTFHVTTRGETDEGVAFRREQRLQMYLDVRPLPEFTLVDVAYGLLHNDDRPWRLAEVTVWPMDAFGNRVLIDSDISNTIVMNAWGGEFTGPLTSNLDGSYTRTLRYDESSQPNFTLRVSGHEVFKRFETAPLNDIRFMDQLIAYTPGKEADPGANQYTDPRTALGDVYSRDSFVALGGRGSITLGITGEVLVAQGNDDVTVFVHSQSSDENRQLRAYEVLARAAGDDRWTSLGESAGTTQSFSLAGANLNSVDAIRIVDTSGIVLDNFEASNAPGVAVLGVGFRQSALKPGDKTGCLGCILGAVSCLSKMIKR